MKAKQILALFLALLTVLTLAVSCGGDPVGTDPVGPSGSGEGSGEGGSGDQNVTDDLGDVNFAGVTNPTVTFYVRTGMENEVWVEELNEDDLNDAIYWRNQAVKERLGVDIAQVAQQGGWSLYQEWNDTLRNAVQTATHDFDAAMIYTGTASSLATEGCYLDLTELDMISLEKPWWNQNLLKEATIYNSLYFASGSIAHSQLSHANVMWFNKDLYNEYFAATEEKDLYQVVRDGEWTIDHMYHLTSQIFEDNDSNGIKSSGDTVGLGGSAHGASGGMDSWVYALGCDLTKMDPSIGEPVACFYDEHTVQAYEKLVNLYSNNEGAYVSFKSGEGTGDTSFLNGNVMMTLGGFGSGASFRDATFAFGVLPVPKFDVEQESYRAIPEVTSSMVVILSTVEAERLDMVSATIELMAAESYKTVIPTYVDVVLKSKQANSPDDAEMVQLIIDSMVYSFGWIFCSTHMGNMGKAFRVVDGSRDLSNYYQTNQSAYEAALDGLIDAFASLA